jgi:hypothetical protein
MSEAINKLDVAIREAGLAYRFGPGSYTFEAYRAVLDARASLDAPDWITETLDWMGDNNVA